MRLEEPGNPNPVTMNPDRPVYQVTFWTRVSAPADVPVEERGFEAAEWKVHEADVRDVLRWAAERGRECHSYTVHVATPPVDGRATLLWLCGDDPTIEVFDDGEYFTLVQE